MFDDEDDKNNKMQTKNEFAMDEEIEDFYDRMKQTEQGFLGLKDNLRLYDEMKIQNKKNTTIFLKMKKNKQKEI